MKAHYFFEINVIYSTVWITTGLYHLLLRVHTQNKTAKGSMHVFLHGASLRSSVSWKTMLPCQHQSSHCWLIEFSGDGPMPKSLRKGGSLVDSWGGNSVPDSLPQQSSLPHFYLCPHMQTPGKGFPQQLVSPVLLFPRGQSFFPPL